MTPAVRRAVVLARSLEGRVPNRPKQREGTPVKAALTDADSAAQEAILVPLLEHFPDVGLRAEEDTPSVAEFPAREKSFVVVDPIDSTLRSYLEGAGPTASWWGSVGEVLRGRPGRSARGGLLLTASARRRRMAGCAESPDRGGRNRSARGCSSPRDTSAVRDRLRERGFEVVSGSGGAVRRAARPRGRAGCLASASAASAFDAGPALSSLPRQVPGSRAREGAVPSQIDEPARAVLVAASEEDMDHLRYALAAAPH
jgi:hypothetical protein